MSTLVVIGVPEISGAINAIRAIVMMIEELACVLFIYFQWLQKLHVIKKMRNRDFILFCDRPALSSRLYFWN